MKAMLLTRPGAALECVERPSPRPGPGEIRLKVLACAVCRTDLHVIDGELPHPKLPLVLGHEIVGRVLEVGAGVTRFRVGDRVGVPWLGGACGHCRYCRRGQENLCESAVFTGYTRDGGFAEETLADARFCFPIPERYGDAEATPLLCAGLIGWRTYAKAGANPERVGIYGFGAAAHLIAQVAIHQGKRIYAFTRPGDVAAQEFARRLGACWAGGSDELPPEPLDAALIFAPVGELVPQALRATDKGGTVVCGGIHMSDIPSFPYRWLWEERTLTSVANLTRADGEAFMQLAAEVPLHPAVTCYPLTAANEAIADLRAGRVNGAAVLIP
ncbi:zinc-dependent alcohol dehydrogenase family protein [Tepidiphilus baoligensis]|uniref:alcohol dehydrogenase n=1 Tax=Tepidiphilus baoligensis TaxID=2698687 RepID=A0ABX1QJK3_9PROT|nr:zinc-dependent alcohol dehydrogenase family protein [Tepidiphilus baoligensis]NMH16158.1 zinc-binding alcohol dehydrogenase family protein [Tepidiphilus baoligensis]